MKLLTGFVFIFFFTSTFAQTQEDLLQKAQESVDSEKYREALHYFNEFLETDSANVEALFGRANCFFELNNLKKAFSDYSRVIELDSTFHGVYYNIGLILESQELYDSALSYYGKYIERDTSDADGYAKVGEMLLYTIPSPDSATCFFEKSLQLDSTNLRTIYYLAKIDLVQEHYENAIQYSDLGIALDSTFTDFLIIKGHAYLYLGNFPASIANSTRALSQDTMNLEAENIFIRANILQKTDPEILVFGQNELPKFKDFTLKNLDKILSDSSYVPFDSLKQKILNGELLSLDQYFLFYLSQQNEPGYSPYFSGANASISEYWKEENYQGIAEISESVFDSNPVNLNDLYKVAVSNYIEERGDAYKAYHAAYLGLMESVMASGNGKSFDSAFVVVSIKDEYALLNYLGLRSGTQSLMHHEGQSFDVLATSDGGEEEIDYYFNIDIPFGSLGRSLGNSDNKESKKSKKKKRKR